VGSRVTTGVEDAGAAVMGLLLWMVATMRMGSSFSTSLMTWVGSPPQPVSSKAQKSRIQRARFIETPPYPALYQKDLSRMQQMG
jgi:hypothetical protein